MLLSSSSSSPKRSEQILLDGFNLDKNDLETVRQNACIPLDRNPRRVSVRTLVNFVQALTPFKDDNEDAKWFLGMTDVRTNLVDYELDAYAFLKDVSGCDEIETVRARVQGEGGDALGIQLLPKDEADIKKVIADAVKPHLADPALRIQPPVHASFNGNHYS